MSSGTKEMPMRKRITVVVCCGLTFVGGWAFGQIRDAGNNGARWKTLTAFEKNLYALGFSRGYEQGFEEAGATAIVNMQSQRSLPVPTPEQKRKFSELAAQARDHSFIGRATIGQITATVDTFYGDYRNMPVCWNDAVLLSSVSLEARAPAQESLEAARKSGAESGCK
jgi:hypothetical protein